MKPAIFVIDDQDPEDNAMMQALYSRSPDSVVNHLEKVKKAGSGKFMDQYYVGYNHQSIGDCGTTTLYIEYVSMLAAKAIQDSPLYNGQEASTRYIDMSQQPILNPLGIREGLEIQDCWMKFYNLAMAPTIEHLKTTYPKQPDEDPKQYEKAIKARSFDLATRRILNSRFRIAVSVSRIPSSSSTMRTVFGLELIGLRGAWPVFSQAVDTVASRSLRYEFC